MERLIQLKKPPHANAMTGLVAIDGPPGVGKTTQILKESQEAKGRTAIITYTNAAAEVARERLQSSECLVGTVYSLTWKSVSRSTGSKQGRGPKAGTPWRNRRVDSSWDPVLDEYEDAAPSKKPKTEERDFAIELHKLGDLDPFKLKGRKELKYVLPLAQWVAQGCPTREEDLFDTIFIDEAQDMSTLELAATAGLLKQGGELRAFMDPGQAIFASTKGIEDQLAPAWLLAEEQSRLQGGFRVGNPIASLASSVLDSYFSRPPESFAKEETTALEHWDPYSGPPTKGLVLGYSRANVARWFRDWDLEKTGIVPGQGSPNTQLVMSTIHSAKGAESYEVFLLPWGKSALERLEDRSPSELRLLYVALTRASKLLYLPDNLSIRVPYL